MNRTRHLRTDSRNTPVCSATAVSGAQIDTFRTCHVCGWRRIRNTHVDARRRFLHIGAMDESSLPSATRTGKSSPRASPTSPCRRVISASEKENL
jgi:hypothetical protein